VSAAVSSGSSGGATADSVMLSHMKGRTLLRGSWMVRHLSTRHSRRKACLGLDSPSNAQRQISGANQSAGTRAQFYFVTLQRSDCAVLCSDCVVDTYTGVCTVPLSACQLNSRFTTQPLPLNT
jgi:hypothetical protein